MSSMANQLPYMPSFVVKPRTYIVHNASPDEVSVRWAGLAFTVPPVDAYSKVPGYYDDGSPIPGTFVIADAYTTDPDGTARTQGAPNWIAAEAVKNMLGIDDQGRAVSAYARKGLSILPEKPSREQVEQIRKNGEARFKEFQVEWAEYQTMAYQEQIARCRQAGVAPRPPGPDYQKALLILRHREEELKKRYGFDQKATSEDPVDLEGEEFRIWALAQAMKLSEKVAEEAKVDQQKLAEKLLEDPEIRKGLQRRYRIRRIGYADVPTPEREAAVTGEKPVYEAEDDFDPVGG